MLQDKLLLDGDKETSSKGETTWERGGKQLNAPQRGQTCLFTPKDDAHAHARMRCWLPSMPCAVPETPSTQPRGLPLPMASRVVGALPFHRPGLA